MRLGIAGWVTTQIEKKLDTEFPILVDMLVLMVDFAIYAAIFKLLSGGLGAI